MPIELAKVEAATIPSVTTSWTSKDIILYHLGLGAGVPPTDPNELAYTYEARLKVLPTWAVIPTFSFLAKLGEIDGLDLNPFMILHGEQDTQFHQVLPTDAEVTNTGRIADVWDKGKAAVVEMEIETRDSDDNLLCTNRMSLFARGEGGFGGEPGPSTTIEVPDREPDHVLRSPTLPQQAVLYRLSGDLNPLHIDPSFAEMGGFDTPILHGLCTYGMVAKAVVDHVLDGDVAAMARYRVRFAGVVYPGETIVTQVWDEGEELHLLVTTEERGEPVLSQAVVTRRST